MVYTKNQYGDNNQPTFVRRKGMLGRTSKRIAKKWN